MDTQENDNPAHLFAEARRIRREGVEQRRAGEFKRAVAMARVAANLFEDAADGFYETDGRQYGTACLEAAWLLMELGQTGHALELCEDALECPETLPLTAIKLRAVIEEAKVVAAFVASRLDAVETPQTNGITTH